MAAAVPPARKDSFQRSLPPAPTLTTPTPCDDGSEPVADDVRVAVAVDRHAPGREVEARRPVGRLPVDGAGRRELDQHHAVGAAAGLKPGQEQRSAGLAGGEVDGPRHGAAVRRVGRAPDDPARGVVAGDHRRAAEWTGRIDRGRDAHVAGQRPLPGDDGRRLDRQRGVRALHRIAPHRRPGQRGRRGDEQDGERERERQRAQRDRSRSRRRSAGWTDGPHDDTPMTPILTA